MNLQELHQERFAILDEFAQVDTLIQDLEAQASELKGVRENLRRRLRAVTAQVNQAAAST